MIALYKTERGLFTMVAEQSACPDLRTLAYNAALDYFKCDDKEKYTIFTTKENFYVLINFYNEEMVFCITRKLTDQTAINNIDLLNEINLRSEHGTFSVCSFDNTSNEKECLFFYRSTVQYNTKSAKDYFVELFKKILVETELGYFVYSNLSYRFDSDIADT